MYWTLIRMLWQMEVHIDNMSPVCRSHGKGTSRSRHTPQNCSFGVEVDLSYVFSYFLLSVCVCVSIRKVHIIPTWQTTPMLLNGVNFTSHSHNSSPAAISVFPQYILRNGSHIKQTYLLFGGLLLLYLICEMSVFLPRRRGFKSNRVEQRNFK